jgi:hypothetical protein
VNPREPDLLEDLTTRIASLLGFGGLIPYGRQKLLPAIVDRERMEGIAHIRVQVMIVEA